MSILTVKSFSPRSPDPPTSPQSTLLHFVSHHFCHSLTFEEAQALTSKAFLTTKLATTWAGKKIFFRANISSTKKIQQ